jgi:hypothetical protein
MPVEVPAEALPCKTASLAPAIQPLEHEMMHRALKDVKGTAVVGHPKVISVQLIPRGRRVPSALEISTRHTG